MKGDRIMVAEKNAMKRTEYKFSWMTCVCARVYNKCACTWAMLVRVCCIPCVCGKEKE